MTYRLLVLDVDGTLLDPEKRVRPAVRRAVADLAASGFPVTFATGRMYEAVAEWVEELGLTTPMICNNGADLIAPGTGERLLHVPLEHETVIRLLDFGEKNKATRILFAAERVLGFAHTEDDWLIERNNEIVEVLSKAELYAPGLRVEKLLYLDRTHPDRLAVLRDEVTASAGDNPGFVAQISEPGILNFSHTRATKPLALQALCDRLQISPSDVIAIGDGDNDAEILKAVGLGIAMGNATPAARAAAALTVPDNEHDGVAVAIRKVILPQLGPPAEPRTD